MLLFIGRHNIVYFSIKLNTTKNNQNTHFLLANNHHSWLSSLWITRKKLSEKNKRLQNFYQLGFSVVFLGYFERLPTEITAVCLRYVGVFLPLHVFANLNAYGVLNWLVFCVFSWLLSIHIRANRLALWAKAAGSACYFYGF